MFNGPVILQAHGQPVRTGTIQNLMYISQKKNSTRETGTRIYTKKVVPMYDRNWITIPAFHACEKDSKTSIISKMVTKMVRHHDQDERDHDGAHHWNTMCPVLLRNFGDQIFISMMYRQRLDWTHAFRQQQDEVRILPKLKKRIGVQSRDPGAYRWDNHQTDVNEKHINSV